MSLYYRQLQRLEGHRQADRIEAVLYGQPQDKKGLQTTLQQIKNLRKA